MTFTKGLTMLLARFVDLFWGIGYFGWQLSMLYAAYVAYSVSWFYLFLYVLIFVLTGLFNHTFLKRYIYDERPLDSQPFLAAEKFKKHVNGMPSGHAQQSAFSLTYAYLLSGKYGYQTSLLFFITMLQRYVFKNHTFMQLLAGAVLGVAIAYFTVYLDKIYSDYTNKNININKNTKK